jgi:carbamoyl-phosphate synthase large subunit
MKKNILVTAVGGRSVGSGIVHALMRANGSAAREKWNVIAADADYFSWGLYIADKAVLLPRADDADYLPSVLEIIRKEKIDAVIPGSEPEVNVFAAHRDQVPVPVICNRAELMPLMLDKFGMTAKLKELGLPYIETLPIGHWRTALSKYDFPFVIKPTIGTGGSRGLHFVCSREELEGILPQLPEAGKFCIQPYIGTGEDEYTVGVLTDKDGRLIDSIVMRRKLLGLSLLHHRTHQRKNYTISTGYSQGYFVRDKAIQEFCECLAQRLQSIGPLNIQFRKKGDEIYVFEIHPRFSGTSTMRADLGFNEPDVLLRNVLYGESFGRLNYRFNVAAIRAFEHVIVPINEMLIKE